MSDITIIGAGPVGLFSVFQAGVLGIKCNVIDTLDVVGGQCISLYPDKYIYDVPAIPKIKSSELIQSLQTQCDVFSPKYFLSQSVVSIKRESNFFIIETSKGNIINTKKIILAIGAGSFEYNKLDIENEEIYSGKSIHYSVKDINLFVDKNVAVLGGGDTAVDWARNLVGKARNIYFIHRRNKLRCLPDSQKILENYIEKGIIKAVIPYKIKEIHGDSFGNMKYASFMSLERDKNIKEIELDYLLPFFGLKPNLDVVEKWGIKIINGVIPVEFSTCKTNIEGIYAIGDVSSYSGKLKLILSGFSEAALACNDIFKKLYSDLPFNWQHSSNKSYLFEKRVDS